MLGGLADNGLDRRELEAAMANLEFQMRERDFGYYPQGLGISFGVLDSWLHGGEPEVLVEVGTLFDTLRARWRRAISRSSSAPCCWRTRTPARWSWSPRTPRGRSAASATRRSSSASPPPGARPSAAREVAAGGARRLAGEQRQPRGPCRAAAAGALDISPEPEEYPTRADELGGVTLLRHELPASGISYVSLYFDITGLGGEETAAVSFLSELLGKVDTAEHPAQELSRLTQLHCGNMSFSVDVYDNSADSYRAKLTARVSALESGIGEALGLLAEVLRSSRLDSEKEVTDILRQKRTGMMQQLMNNGHVSAIGRAGSQLAAGPAATSGPTATTTTAG